MAATLGLLPAVGNNADDRVAPSVAGATGVVASD